MELRSVVLVQPRRVGITGTIGSGSPAEVQRVACFCRAIGRALARRNAVVVTRGGPSDDVPPGRPIPVDEWVARGAEAELLARGHNVEDWIETVLSDASSEGQVHIGTLTKVRGRTFEAERFGFVNRIDGIVGVSGARGTQSSLVLALATERPILPVPTFGGPAREVWTDHEADLMASMGLGPLEAQRWRTPPDSDDAAERLATEMVDALLDSMARHCFVAMPFESRHNALFDFVIEPAIRGLGDEPIRLDRLEVPGDVGQQIQDAIQRADYVIAVLDGLRPNVLYELGLAHGRNKPTILVNQKGSLGADVVPFDLSMQQRLEYDELNRGLPARLQAAIRALGRL